MNPLATTKPKHISGLHGAQEQWANQYLNQAKAGTAKASELGRYLGYNGQLGLSQNNVTKGNGANLQAAQKDWFNQYSKKVSAGVNNTNEMQQYKDYSKAFGMNMAAPNEQVMKQLSIEALNGSRFAQQQLTALGSKGQSGAQLWKGFDPSGLQKGSAAMGAYMKDNPFSQQSKSQDDFRYKQYSEIIKNGGQLDNNMNNIYQGLLDKWNLDDMRDPFTQQQATLAANKQTALDSQDVALNTGLGQQDAANFQQFQKMEQDMSERGMGASGIAQDAYMRAQMGMNQNLQQSYADSAETKSKIQSQYDEAISGSKIEQGKYQDEKQLKATEQQIAIQAAQTEQDKFLTESTGLLYVGGQQMTMNGRPITTIEFQKMTEEQRHNMAEENNVATKNAQSYALGSEANSIKYSLGSEGNAIKRDAISADLQIALAKNTLDYAKLDFDYTKLESNNAYNQDKIAQAAAASQNATDKNQLTALGQQSNTLANQIIAAQKAGKPKKDYKDLVERYNAVNGKISALVGGASFQVQGEGVGQNLRGAQR